MIFSYILYGYLKIFKNGECLQYLPEITQHPDKKNPTKHDNKNLQRVS